MTYYNEVWIPTAGVVEEITISMNSDIREFEENGDIDLSSNIREKALPAVEKELKSLGEVEPENKDIKKLNQMTIETEEKRIELLEQAILYGEDKQSMAAVQNIFEEYSEEAHKVNLLSMRPLKN